MSIPQETIDEVLRRADMVKIVGRYTNLRKQGANFVGLCPFHNEKSPSFGINPEKGAWHCFGCQVGGGLLNFLMKVESMGFVDTVVKLGEEVGIRVEIEETDDPFARERRRLLELLERTSIFYHELLMRSPIGKVGLEYLEGRGLGRDTIVKFRLGWAPDGGQALLQKLQTSGYSVQEAVASGVVQERDGRSRDLLRNRVVFPIFDAQDKVLAFGGRVLDANQQPKYLNSPETEIYSKRRHLYGLNAHRSAIGKADRAVLVEGYLDVVSLAQAEVPLAVASLGTSLTPEQAGLLRKYTRNVVMAYDADKAGQSATLKGLELFETAGLRVQIVSMQPGEDPDSLARREGKAGVEACLSRAVGVVEYHIERCEKLYDLSTPEGKEDFAGEVLPAVEKIQDRIRRDSYIPKLAQKLGVSEARVAWMLSNRRVAMSPRAARGKLDDRSADVRLLLLCLSDLEGLTNVLANVGEESFQQERLRCLYRALVAFGNQGRLPGLQDLQPHIEDPDALGDLTELLVMEAKPSSPEDIQKLIRSTQVRQLTIQLERLRSEVLPALNAGMLGPEDERYLEYKRLQRLLKGAQ